MHEFELLQTIMEVSLERYRDGEFPDVKDNVSAINALCPELSSDFVFGFLLGLARGEELGSEMERAKGKEE